MVLGRVREERSAEVPWLRSAKSRPAPLPPGHVRRARLSQVLDSDVPFALVTAPPGFGKTVAVLEWADTTDWQVGWLTLDRFDDDPAHLWAGITEAVRSVGDEPVDPGRAGREPRPMDDLTVLGDVLDALRRSVSESGPVAIVLDEMHWLRRREVWEQLAYVIDHAPPSARFIGITRGHPHLPLGRWRAQSRLVEVRESDLRFDRAEAMAVLRPYVDLTDGDVDRVHATTDGWAVALRLAGSAMAMSPDPAALLDRFGSDQLLVDYVVSEVVDRLSAHEHEVMVALALHGTLDRSTCVLVCGRDDAWSDLLHLADEKLFVMAADASRTFVRLHSLVAELIVAEATARAPDLIDHVRRRSAGLRGVDDHPSAATDRVVDPSTGHYDTARLPVHIEPFTDREREVLVLLPTHLTYAEIAAELFVSINTVKTYVKSIYRKLGVSSRGDSVSAARTVGLI